MNFTVKYHGSFTGAAPCCARLLLVNRGLEMDFFRRVLLVLCISTFWFQVASASSLQDEPARTSTAPDKASTISTNVLSKTVMAAATQTSTTYYGPPYYQYGYANYGPWGSISAAVQAWWANYQQVFPGAFPGCSYTLQLLNPSTTNNNDRQLGEVAQMPLSGTCGGWGRVKATASTYATWKNLGKQCNCAGDPIDVATGNEYRDEEDLSLDSLSFHRYYNSQISVASSHIGANWRHSFDRSVEYLTDGTNYIATVYRPNGMQVKFTLSSDQWVADTDVPDQLTEQTGTSGSPTGWTYFDASTRYQESYDQSGNLLSITDTNGLVTTFSYSTASTPVSVAPAPGLLLTVTDPHGRLLSFTYNTNSEVATVTEPDGGVLTYAYNTSGNLSSVTYPDKTSRQYVYNESSLTGGTSLPNALTGDIDETDTRLTSIGYNSQGQATMSMLATNIDKTQVSYGSGGTTTVTYPLGVQTTLGFVTPSGSMHTSTVSAPCGPQCGQPNASATFDANGYQASTTDFNGNVSLTTYDANGLLDQEIDAQGASSQRATNFTWDTTLRVPLTRTVSNAGGTTISSTQWVYNTIGQPLARCDVDPTNSAASGYSCSNTGTIPAGVRRWTYTYCTAVGTGCPLTGLMLTATGPRTDLTQTASYSYYTSSSATDCGTPGAACYQAGDLYQVTDALGHVTTIASYDADGRITRLTDANGVNTDMTYTPRGWLASRTVGGTTTSFTYTPYGTVQTVTDPDGVTTTYGYDAAHRLVKITDALGNYIQYTLDAAGDKTAEQVYDSSGTLHKSLTRTFNTLGQLTTVVDGLNNTVFNASASGSYDANGNLIQSIDGLNIPRQLGYDALNRLVQTIDNYNGTDTATKNTTAQYSYDSLDRLTQLTDPSSLNTTYSYDGLSDATGQVSPDTGTTSRSFDAAGNVLTRTDAKGITATNTYDALDRLISTSYPDNTQNVTYSYDDPNSITGCSTSYPVGRLTRIIENSVTTVYCYDAQGRVTSKGQSIEGSFGAFPVKQPNLGECPAGMMCANDMATTAAADVTGYAYTAAGRLSGITYPSGTLVSYTRDGDGRIQSVSLTPPNGTASSAVNGVTYQPFGPISGYTLGNGQQIARTYDANYRLTDLTSPAFNLHVARDAMGDITAMGNAPGANPATETYAYDPLYRLLSVTEANGATLESVTYNPTGDRLTKTGNGLATGTYTYNTGTHQLNATGNAARTVDADGNTTAITKAGSTYGFGYSDRNRMIVAQLGSSTIANYTYNALSQRIQKVANSATERYDYNEASQMLGEYGATNRDYIWMDGIPVANVDTNGMTSTIAYVTADQLGTPRAVANSSGTTEWQSPYQGNPWNEVTPTSTGYTYNLGFPGQYFDLETGLTDWGFRTYDSGTGRSLQSDPIGLWGGINSYAYALNSPLNYSDPTGLFVRGTYSISTGLLTMYDTSDPIDVYTTYANTGGTYQPDGTFIPNGDAIPVGTYDILGARTPGWYRLDPEDSHPFNDVNDATGHGAFRLHPGTHSLGCITVNKNSYNNTLYKNIENLLDHTMTTTITDQAQRSLIPGPWPVRFGPSVGTPVTYYGKLVVTP
ncbi:RHS repeat-associated core domain-containing protein [Dyella psychrodurans]|uniref:DUF2778 domain-containing protein n=1 Tax=Dyella psychrodurans TaxID=1927960 RepID=A0A370X7P3_9GAMM|nr:RHS repeat-associated core domain-containing protein [Dyella psychrodurans]RDS84297.1 DUF2778 domain-containing protein [Dyella psychrodurans]